MSAFELLRKPPAGAAEDRKIFLFDIDNTLYRKSTGIGDLMQDYIRDYIEKTLDLPPEEADELHHSYYKHYGLAVEGLVRKNHIDAMDYNVKVDDSKQNVDAAEKINWKAIHIDEPDAKDQPEDMTHVPLDENLKHGKVPKIHYIYQLPLVCPELFE